MSGLPGYGDDLDRVSHGESFLQVFAGRFASPGLYLLDEPESGLAFEALLQLLIVMHRVSTIGGQIVCATHSPVLTAFPGAEIIELSEQGMAVRKWSELDLVQDWKAFLSNPEAFVHRLLPEEHV
jgi:predicted ATPase